MGRHTYSSAVPFKVYVGGSDTLEEFDHEIGFSKNGWVVTGDAVKYKKLYTTQVHFMGERAEEYVHFSEIFNDDLEERETSKAEQDNALNEMQEMEKGVPSIHIVNESENACVGGVELCIFSDKREDLEKFCKDLGIEGDIVEGDTVQETL